MNVQKWNFQFISPHFSNMPELSHKLRMSHRIIKLTTSLRIPWSPSSRLRSRSRHYFFRGVSSTIETLSIVFSIEMYIFLLEAEDFTCNKPVNLLYLLYQN